MEIYWTRRLSQINTLSHLAWLEKHFSWWMVLLVLCMGYMFLWRSEALGGWRLSG
jgi:hypothetical protein